MQSVRRDCHPLVLSSCNHISLVVSRGIQPTTMPVTATLQQHSSAGAVLMKVLNLLMCDRSVAPSIPVPLPKHALHWCSSMSSNEALLHCAWHPVVMLVYTQCDMILTGGRLLCSFGEALQPKELHSSASRGQDHSAIPGELQR